MRPATDHAWERPSVAADSAADASEVEPVAVFTKLDRRFRIHRNIRHQRAADRLLALAKHTPAHPASRSIRTNQQPALKAAALGDDPNPLRILAHLDDAFIFDDLESCVRRRPRKHRVETVAP